MSYRRLGACAIALATGITLIGFLGATGANAGCYVSEGGGTYCSPTPIGGTVDRTTTTTFTQTDYNFGVPTAVTVTFPPSVGTNFTFSGFLNPVSICTAVLPCNGSGLDLGTIPSGYSATNPVVVTFDIAGVSTPPLLPGWYKKPLLPVGLPELPCAVSSILLPVPCNVSQTFSGGHIFATDHVMSGDPILGH